MSKPVQAPARSEAPTGAAGPTHGNSTNSIDLEALAAKVYRLLLEDLRLDRARRSGRER